MISHATEKYRPEIDGLRALAVLPVILFHAGSDSFRGGYVGVDVFFVISGYLITGIILNDKRRGVFTLARFYERRARRILPALFLVVAACLIPAWVLMTPPQLRELAQSIVGVALFSSNVVFWKKSGYFDPAIEEKPLIHTWSLGVEEQFYVLFPLLIAALWGKGPRTIGWVISSIALGSLAISEYSSREYPNANFYLMPSRAWELMVGALIAVGALDRRLCDRVGRHTREALAWIGIGLLGYSVSQFNHATRFPSLYALVPVLGTSLLIVFTPETRIGRFLSLRPIVDIGLISYGLYLWHQPFFVFARIYSPVNLASSDYALLIAASFVLAYLSWRFVEVPFRNREYVSRPTIVRFSVTCTVAALAVGLGGHYGKGFEARFDLPAELLASFERTKRLTECFDIDHAHKSDVWYCVVDKYLPSPPTYLVVGDSHALSMLPAFETASRLTARNGILTGFSACPPILGIHPLGRTDQSIRDCHSLNTRVFEYVRDKKIRDVFLVARWTYYTDAGYSGQKVQYIGQSKDGLESLESSRRVFAEAFGKTVSAYRSIGVRLSIIEQAPQQVEDPRSVYYRIRGAENDLASQVRSFSVSLDRHRGLQSFVTSVFGLHRTTPGLRFISIADKTCDAAVCFLGTDSVSYYSDGDHLSRPGASLLVNDIVWALNRD